jgi:PncC family amidohydrolase
MENSIYDQNVIAAIREYLLRYRQTLAVAESVTSGHLQAALSLADGARNFFHGGITAYNLGQKARHLKVDPILAETCNSVSERTCEEMALHCLDLFSCDWSIAVTGYAAPVPELNVHDLYCFCSVAFRGNIVQTLKIESAQKDIFQAQVEYADRVLKAFLSQLKNFRNSVKKISRQGHRQDI